MGNGQTNDESFSIFNPYNCFNYVSRLLLKKTSTCHRKSCIQSSKLIIARKRILPKLVTKEREYWRFLHSNYYHPIIEVYTHSPIIVDIGTHMWVNTNQTHNGQYCTRPSNILSGKFSIHPYINCELIWFSVRYSLFALLKYELVFKGCRLNSSSIVLLGNSRGKPFGRT